MQNKLNTLEASQESLGGLSAFQKKHILLGVTGGIAAYKSVLLLRLMREAGHRVTVIPTASALNMVGPTTWEALSGEPIQVEVSDKAANVQHIHLADQADLLVIAPLTANTGAKLANGLADNLLTSTALSVKCPILVAPAMHTQMWEHPATSHNMQLLAERGVYFVGPESGRLTGVDSGMGRLSEPETIFRHVVDLLTNTSTNKPNEDEANLVQPLSGVKLAVSGGGTHEPIDPVRYIANHSTGTMAIAIANAAVTLGAEVTLVGANIAKQYQEKINSAVNYLQVQTALDLEQAMNTLQDSHQVLIMAAAVSDYRVSNATDKKIKRTSELELKLVSNPDILAGLVARRENQEQLIVGFAAETG
ncbi:MAG: bifunctional phosphopantothenoylcysteine decarboxylase/phosphopantothenate--cysteine ligase CoaBC, partial [Arcanobacterium sp.]|nr:bifunctional phosphopantothenoylcysteine decarboxylase/phosphopantothenate--cysteine ligase CoaBC [Arcanobacterium sp.]